jgi:hypothetical protein
LRIKRAETGACYGRITPLRFGSDIEDRQF